MPCNLDREDPVTLPGVTLFSKPGSPCQKRDTFVYLPPRHPDFKDAKDPIIMLNVVLWLHGWHVKNIKHLFDGDRAQVRKTVLDSGKDVVLIAPFLGRKEKKATSTAP